LIRVAKLGLVLYVAVFVLAACYASLLLWAAMRGLHGASNTLIFGCGALFIVRAIFATRAGLLRLRELSGAQPAAVPWAASDKVFAIGDVVAVGSLALTAWVFSTNEDRMGAPMAPFGTGLAIAYPFYFAATFRRLRRELSGT